MASDLRVGHGMSEELCCGSSQLDCQHISVLRCRIVWHASISAFCAADLPGNGRYLHVPASCAADLRSEKHSSISSQPLQICLAKVTFCICACYATDLPGDKSAWRKALKNLEAGSGAAAAAAAHARVGVSRQAQIPIPLVLFCSLDCGYAHVYLR
eukprot:scaffold62253_cov19-Tisochrysis_lutea.AAC.5